MNNFKISLLECYKDNEGKPQGNFTKVVGEVTSKEFIDQELWRTKAYSPFIYMNNKRNEENSRPTSVLMYDVDDVTDIEYGIMIETLKPYTSVVFGSQNYTEENKKVRIILPVGNLQYSNKDSYKQIYTSIAKALNIPFDAQTIDIARLYFPTKNRDDVKPTINKENTNLFNAGNYCKTQVVTKQVSTSENIVDRIIALQKALNLGTKTNHIEKQAKYSIMKVAINDKEPGWKSLFSRQLVGLVCPVLDTPEAMLEFLDNQIAELKSSSFKHNELLIIAETRGFEKVKEATVKENNTNIIVGKVQSKEVKNSQVLYTYAKEGSFLTLKEDYALDSVAIECIHSFYAGNEYAQALQKKEGYYIALLNSMDDMNKLVESSRKEDYDLSDTSHATISFRTAKNGFSTMYSVEYDKNGMPIICAPCINLHMNITIYKPVKTLINGEPVFTMAPESHLLKYNLQATKDIKDSEVDKINNNFGFTALSNICRYEVDNEHLAMQKLSLIEALSCGILLQKNDTQTPSFRETLEKTLQGSRAVFLPLVASLIFGDPELVERVASEIMRKHKLKFLVRSLKGDIYPQDKNYDEAMKALQVHTDYGDYEEDAIEYYKDSSNSVQLTLKTSKESPTMKEIKNVETYTGEERDWLINTFNEHIDNICKDEHGNTYIKAKEFLLNSISRTFKYPNKPLTLKERGYFVFYGTQGTGKGLLKNILEKAMGENLYSFGSIGILGKLDTAFDMPVQQLSRANMIFFNELETTHNMSETLKEFIEKNSLVQNVKYKKPNYFSFSATCFMALNEQNNFDGIAHYLDSSESNRRYVVVKQGAYLKDMWSEEKLEKYATMINDDKKAIATLMQYIQENYTGDYNFNDMAGDSVKNSLTDTKKSNADGFWKGLITDIINNPNYLAEHHPKADRLPATDTVKGVWHVFASTYNIDKHRPIDSQANFNEEEGAQTTLLVDLAWVRETYWQDKRTCPMWKNKKQGMLDSTLTAIKGMGNVSITDKGRKPFLKIEGFKVALPVTDNDGEFERKAPSNNEGGNKNDQV